MPASQTFIRIERAGDNVARGGTSGNVASSRAERVAIDAPAPATNIAPAPRRSLLDAMRDNAERSGTAAPVLGAPTFGTNADNSTLGTPNFGVPNATPVAARNGLSRNGANGNDASVLNARVYDGDRVTVEAIAAIRVTVDGDVVKADAFEVPPGTNLVDVLARAGGQTSKANLENVSIRHANGTSEVVNVRDAVLFGAASPPIELRDGDYIVVGRSSKLIYVVGGVRNSDYYSVPPSGFLTLGESLSLAGGPAPGARLNKIAISRNTPSGVQHTEVDLNQKKGQILTADLPIRAGDVVYVPEANNSPSTLQKVANAIGAFGVLGAFR